MSKNYGNDNQLAEIVGYISDNMKLPIMGAGGGFAPIGTEAYFDGQVAPLGWIICDGTELNIADYPDLATYYASQHGASNYYGGNGTTTFATPKRSGMPNNEDSVYGENEHIVGVWRETVDGVLKQKPVYEVCFSATSPSSDSVIKTIEGISTVVDIRGFIVAGSNQIIPIQWAYSSSYSTVYFTLTNGTLDIRQTSTPSTYQEKPEKITIQYTKTTDQWQTVQEGHSADGNGVFCVKATISGDANGEVYSTEEMICGHDIDEGKNVYKKEYVVTNESPIDVSSLHIDEVYDLRIVANNSSYAISSYYVTTDSMDCYYNRLDNLIMIRLSGSAFVGAKKRITIKYTKTTD